MKWDIFFVCFTLLMVNINATLNPRVVTSDQAEIIRVAGGQSVKLGDRPYFAGLFIELKSGNSIPWCGGTILNEYWILTAENCFINVLPLNTTKVFIQAGNIYSKRSSHTQQRSDIAARFMYPNHTTVFGDNDIALLKLETPLKFNDYVKPIDLPAAESVPTSQYGTLTGFGSLHSTAKFEIPEVLQTVDLPIIDNDTCNELLDAPLHNVARSKLDDSLLCAAPTPTNQGYCWCDAGDPFIVDNKVIGIATLVYSIDCEMKNIPSIFTRVSSYLEWIQDTMSKK